MSLDSQLTLEADEEAVVSFLDEFDGLLVRDLGGDGTYWLVIHPKSAPHESYYARVAWTTYPDEAPSVRFCDGIRGEHRCNRAWPNVPGYRLGEFDICQPFTAEAFNVHPEWRTGPQAWTSTGNPFLWVATNLQNGLNHNYSGRHA